VNGSAIRRATIARWALREGRRGRLGLGSELTAKAAAAELAESRDQGSGRSELDIRWSDLDPTRV
jgi:hypothetical protein